MISFPSIPEIILFIALFLSPEGTENLVIVNPENEFTGIERIELEPADAPWAKEEYGQAQFWEIESMGIWGSTPTHLISQNGVKDYSSLTPKLSEHDWSKENTFALNEKITLIQRSSTSIRIEVQLRNRMEVYLINFSPEEESRPVYRLSLSGETLTLNDEAITAAELEAWLADEAPPAIFILKVYPATSYSQIQAIMASIDTNKHLLRLEQ